MTLLLLLLLSRFSCVRLFATPWTRQEHWSGLPFPSPMQETEKWKWSRSVVSDSVWPHRLQPSRVLCPWDFPGKRTEVGCHCLLCDDIAAWLQTSSLSYFLIGAQPFQSVFNIQCDLPLAPSRKPITSVPGFFFWLHTLACGTLVLWPGIKPTPPAL